MNKRMCHFRHNLSGGVGHKLQISNSLSRDIPEVVNVDMCTVDHDAKTDRRVGLGTFPLGFLQ
jgi:predicted ABC-type transport system involved in lysophospholipase L1 biosynthesis ATPase subunit